MPFYDFKCHECVYTEERRVRISEREDQTCTYCGAPLAQLVTKVNISKSWEDNPVEVRGHGTFTSRAAFDKHCEKNGAVPVTPDSSYYKEHEWQAATAAEAQCVELGYRDGDDFRRNYKKDLAEKNAELKSASS